MTRRANSDPQEAAFNTEHMAAYALAATALILGIIGLLRGFGILGNDEVRDVGEAGTRDIGFPAIWDGVTWLLPAIAAALLSFALHRNDHHRLRDPERTTDPDEAGWKTEHMLAYVMALVSIVCAVLGMLVGFNVFGRDFGDQPDGIPWHLASVLTAILANTLHSVRHHQMSREDTFIIERRDTTAGTTGRTTAAPRDAGRRR